MNDNSKLIQWWNERHHILEGIFWDSWGMHVSRSRVWELQLLIKASDEFIIMLIVIEANSLICCSLDPNIKIMSKKITNINSSTGCEDTDLLHNCWDFDISIALGYRHRRHYIIQEPTACCTEFVENWVVLKRVSQLRRTEIAGPLHMKRPNCEGRSYPQVGVTWKQEEEASSQAWVKERTGGLRKLHPNPSLHCQPSNKNCARNILEGVSLPASWLKWAASGEGKARNVGGGGGVFEEHGMRLCAVYMWHWYGSSTGCYEPSVRINCWEFLY
jgi:hypothetical protein